MSSGPSSSPPPPGAGVRAAVDIDSGSGGSGAAAAIVDGTTTPSSHSPSTTKRSTTTDLAQEPPTPSTRTPPQRSATSPTLLTSLPPTPAPAPAPAASALTAALTLTPPTSLARLPASSSSSAGGPNSSTPSASTPTPAAKAAAAASAKLDLALDSGASLALGLHGINTSASPHTPAALQQQQQQGTASPSPTTRRSAGSRPRSAGGVSTWSAGLTSNAEHTATAASVQGEEASQTTPMKPIKGETGRLGELKRFTLYETKTRFYLVAFNTSQTRFRILKIDRTLAQPRAGVAPEAGVAPAVPSAAAASASTQQAGENGAAAAAAMGSAQAKEGLPSHDGDAAAALDTSANGAAAASSSVAEEPSSEWELNLTSDRVVYTRTQIGELLDMIAEGNRSTGGLKEIGKYFGIVGFIRFTQGYYMVLISSRSVVALIGGHYVYHCDDTKIVPVCHPSVLAALPGRSKVRDAEEAKLLHTFKQVDLSKNFYFSYTYDLTKTLQDNLTAPPDERPGKANGATATHHGGPLRRTTAWGYNEKFVWNHHLLQPAFGKSEHSGAPTARAEATSSGEDGGGEAGSSDSSVGAAAEWVLPLVYGFVDQAKLSVLNRTVHITLIARRSRHFAGARFLKRGTDELGHVANDVETEQIVAEGLTTPFYAPARMSKTCKTARAGGEEEQDGKPTLGPNPRYTSYVMHRGSIPIYWTQDSTNMSPRPPIEISVVDPYFSSAALHFDDLLRRYGHPVIVLNLIKSKEKQPREVKLLHAFGECVAYLNQFLPADRRLRYIAWDMSRASKSHDQDVIGVLEDIAEETVDATRFFHTGPEPSLFEVQSKEIAHAPGPRRKTILLQSGVARVNCVDCLDRTNAAQFVIGKAALGHQLHALGLLGHPSLPFDSAAVDMLTEMYHDLGDTIALQYGGSHLVNTMETYRKVNQWTSHSRDMLEGLKRYYSNSFVDADKQAAINLFLGIDPDTPELGKVVAVKKKAMVLPQKRRSYQRWFTPENLEPRGTLVERQQRLREVVTADTGFWAEYYRPSLFTDLLRHHAFKMTAVHQHAQQDSSFPSTAAYVQASRFAQSATRKPSHGAASSSGGARSTSLGSLSEVQSAINGGASPSTTATSLIMPSPFTARLPGGGWSNPIPASPARSVRGSSIQAPSSSPSSSGFASVEGVPPRAAMLGGVRRWMSLNRGGDVADDASSSGGTTRGQKNGRRRTSTRQGGAVIEDARVAVTLPYGAEKEAWPTWESITATLPSSTTSANNNGNGSTATSSAASLAYLVANLTQPVVSTDEAREYTNWLAQFQALTSLAPGSSTRIADADALLYRDQAELAAGEAGSVARLMAGIGGVEEDAGAGAVDAALVAYAVAAQALTNGQSNFQPSEAKLRAYSKWLAG